jgi:drug/metabolite transporter (DMT)-like permease
MSRLRFCGAVMDKTVCSSILIWFVSSALLSTWSNTAFLRFFNDPLLHIIVRFVGVTLVGCLALVPSGYIPISDIPVMMKHLGLPAALLFIANYSNSVALAASGITLTYVVKSSIPVITVAICAVRGEETIQPIIYASLVPICLGVALASGSDIVRH